MEYITVEEFVKRVLATLPQPYAANLVDQFFLAVETRPEWLDLYDEMARQHGEFSVKKSIGFNILAETGMRSRNVTHPATSRLIDTYTEIEPDPAAGTQASPAQSE